MVLAAAMSAFAGQQLVVLGVRTLDGAAVVQHGSFEGSELVVQARQASVELEVTLALQGTCERGLTWEQPSACRDGVTVVATSTTGDVSVDGGAIGFTTYAVQDGVRLGQPIVLRLEVPSTQQGRSEITFSVQQPFLDVDLQPLQPLRTAGPSRLRSIQRAVVPVNTGHDSVTRLPRRRNP